MLQEDADAGRDHERQGERDDLRQADPRAPDLVDVLRAREGQQTGERAADRRPPGHQPEQDERESERSHHLHERVAACEGGAEEHPVGEVDDPAREHTDREGEPVGPAGVSHDVVRDQGAGGTDGAEGDVQHAGRPVQHDEADARERVHAPERQPDHDEGLEELPVHAEHARARRLVMWCPVHPDRRHRSMSLSGVELVLLLPDLRVCASDLSTGAIAKHFSLTTTLPSL